MDSKELSVVKSNDIIEARYRLDVLEQKFILYMVSLINPEDTDFKNLTVKVADFERVMNASGSKWGNIYSVVRDIILSLNEKPLQIIKEDGTKVIINWIASAEIKPRTGVINFEFSERLKPYLLQLKSRFTLYKLNNIVRLNSAYSIRMYEFLKSFQYKGGVTYGVEDLKTVLGVSDKYDDYRDFKKRVLNTAQQELSKKSDICFDYTEQRENRRISKLDFKIYENPETPDHIHSGKNKRKAKTPNNSVESNIPFKPKDAAQGKRKQQNDLKADMERQKKDLSDAIWAEKRKIVEKLLRENPAILEVASEGRVGTLFSTYDNAIPMWKNFKTNSIFAQVRITTALEKHAPQYFEHLTAKTAQLAMLEKKLVLL